MALNVLHKAQLHRGAKPVTCLRVIGDVKMRLVNDYNQHASWEAGSGFRRLRIMMMMVVKTRQSPRDHTTQNREEGIPSLLIEGRGPQQQSSMGFGVWLGKLLGCRVRLEQTRDSMGSYWLLSRL